MEDSRRERLGVLLEHVLGLPVEQRADFIEGASGEDAVFREELASLAAALEPSWRYFDALAEQVGPALAAAADLAGPVAGFDGDGVAISDVVSHYEILECIGGGMGVVYRARDLRLGRPVGLKFLPPALATDEWARERLYAEARAASALDHPNIGTVYEIGEAEPGGLYIALAWYEGETLKETLRRGPLPLAEAVALARQIAGALVAAHVAGIVHRDVKPSNIVQTSRGTPKLVDFGIAKVAGTEPTREGWAPGTLAYMSPEQTRGDNVDARTDVWGLGVVLYEMLAGRRPFRAENDATLIHAIRHDEPESLTILRSDVPPALAAIVETCLAKDSSVRYAGGDDLLAALGTQDDAGSDGQAGRRTAPGQGREERAGKRVGARALRRGEAAHLPEEEDELGSSIKDSLPRGYGPNPRRARALVAVVLLSLLSAMAAAYFVLSQRDGPYAGEPVSLAVLPFQVSGGGLEEWEEEGIAHLLSAALDGVAGIRAVNSRTLLSRWHRELDAGRAADLATVLRVAGASGARFALEGSAVSIGQDLRLVARVYDLDRDAQVGTARIEGSLDAPHALIDRLGIEVLRVLFGGNVAELPWTDLAAVTTTSTEALRAYLRGERLFYREHRYEDAVEAYERAVAIDSTFALAFHRLHLAVSWLGPAWTPFQQQYGDRARELAARLPERERLLVAGTLRMTRSPTDPTRLETTLEEAVERYPRDAEVLHLLAETLYHDLDLVRNPFDVEEMFARAVRLDPGFAPYQIHLVDHAFWLHGDSAMAADRIAAYRQAASPEDPYLAAFEAGLTFMFGDSMARPAALTTLRGSGGPSMALYAFVQPLHPGLLLRQEAFLRFALEEMQGVPIGLRGLALGRNLAAQGRFVEALEIARMEGISTTEQGLCLLSELVLLGYSVPHDTLRTAIDDPRMPGTARAALCKALLATALGVRSAFDAQREQFAAFMQEADDETSRDQVEDVARVADLYWAWRQENAPAEGIRRLTTEGGAAGAVGWKYWLGEMYRDLGQLRQAEEAYLASLSPVSGWPSVHAWYRLAGIYDERNDGEKARDAWQRVSIGWENADAELQPRVEEARARLAALDPGAP